MTKTQDIDKESLAKEGEGGKPLTVPSTAELFDACGILFGPEIEVSLDFLRYLRPAGLKAAFWKKALETHPDRARALGEDESKMNELFKEVTLAYEKLNSAIRDGGIVLLKDDRRVQRNRKWPSAGQETRTPFSDHFYTGHVPRRELLIGEFLYYSGLISWYTLIRAITWQRRQRPLIGQMALQWGMLAMRDIQGILKGRNLREKFGECALRKGYLTPYQLMVLLGRQRRLQHPIGGYFLKQGILRPRDLDKMLKMQRIHNRNCFWGRWE